MNEVEEKEKLFRELLVHPKLKSKRKRFNALAVELESPEYTLDVAKALYGKRTHCFWQLYRNEFMRISPPLTISKEEIKKMGK